MKYPVGFFGGDSAAARLEADVWSNRIHAPANYSAIVIPAADYTGDDLLMSLKGVPAAWVVMANVDEWQIPVLMQVVLDEPRSHSRIL